MTRDKAIDRVRKLRSVTVERGATHHEAATAAALAAQLSAHFRLDGPVAPAPAPAPAVTADRRSPQSLRFVAFA